MEFVWPTTRRTALNKARKAYEKLAAKGDDDDLDQWFAYHRWQAERAIYLRRLCFALEIPMPEIPYEKDGDSNWERSQYIGGWLLTPEGLDKVNVAIHAAKSRRFEVLSRWVVLFATVLGALTGVIGAAIGLVAIWP